MMDPNLINNQSQVSAAAAVATSSAALAAQQKRGRTRISDEQLKVLRAHFDINNSPSEEQVWYQYIQECKPWKQWICPHVILTFFEVFYLIIDFVIFQRSLDCVYSVYLTHCQIWINFAFQSQYLASSGCSSWKKLSPG